MDLNQLDSELTKQKSNLAILQECLKNINEALQQTDSFDTSKDVTEMLKDLKLNLDNCRNSIQSLEALKEEYPKLISNNQVNLTEISNAYNELLTKTANLYNNFLLNYIKSTSFILNKTDKTAQQFNMNFESSSFKLNDQNNSDISSNISANPISELTVNQNFNNNITKSTHDHEEKQKDYLNYDSSDNLGDNNVLLISERKNKIYLPYKVEDLYRILEHNKRYSSIKEIINKRYILPLDKHKNSTISRFKEAYKFMRNKEKASIIDSLDFALELAFNYKLNPAIILACKNLEELDTYLDCLELNQLGKFDCFEIKYEMLPTRR